VSVNDADIDWDLVVDELAENNWLTLWVWEGDEVPDEVPARLCVAVCESVVELVGEQVNDGVKLLLGVDVSVRLCDWVSEGVPVDVAEYTWETLWVCEGEKVPVEEEEKLDDGS
jgi:hypothetical protein